MGTMCKQCSYNLENMKTNEHSTQCADRGNKWCTNAKKIDSFGTRDDTLEYKRTSTGSVEMKGDKGVMHWKNDEREGSKRKVGQKFRR